MTNIVARYERTRMFSDREAWKLFQIGAISEAVGWTLLISGIALKKFVFHGNNTPVLLAGQTHGVLFSFYLLAALLVYPSLRWSRWKTLLAIAASVPPYGSLVFEQWAAYKRRHAALKNYRELIVYGLIVREDELMCVQLSDSGDFTPPGGLVLGGESAEAALSRLMKAQSGVEPILGRLAYITQSRRKSTEIMTMYFVIENTANFDSTRLNAHAFGSKIIDAVRFLTPLNNQLVRPEFVQSLNARQITNRESATQIVSVST